LERNELIKALINCANPGIAPCVECHYYGVDCRLNLMLAAADALKAADEKIADCVAAIDALDDSNDAYIKENERLNKRIAELEARFPKWTSVNRPPEESGTYLTIDMDHAYLCMYPIRYSAKWRGWNCLDYTDDEKEARTHEMHVTHWMPLPDEPEAE